MQLFKIDARGSPSRPPDCSAPTTAGADGAMPQ